MTNPKFGPVTDVERKAIRKRVADRSPELEAEIDKTAAAAMTAARSNNFDPVHRGPPKDGKRQVSIFLTEAEYAALVAKAEENFRSATQHARALIVAGCKP